MEARAQRELNPVAGISEAEGEDEPEMMSMQASRRSFISNDPPSSHAPKSSTGYGKRDIHERHES